MPILSVRALLSLGFNLFILYIMNQNLIGRSRGVMRAPLTPIVTARISEQAPLRIEAGTADGSIDAGEPLQPLFIVLVPEVHDAVPTDRGESPMPLVKAYAIHGVNVVILSMTLESERLLSVNFGHVVDSNPPLDASHGVSRGVRKGGDAPALELERTINPLVFLRLSLDVVRYDVSSSGGNDHQVVPHVQIVTPFGELQHPDRVGLTRVPEFEHLIPPARYDQVGRGEKGDRLDGLIVRADLLGDVIGGALPQLPHAHGLVGSDGEDGAAVGGEAGVKNWGVIFVVHCFLWVQGIN